MHSKKVKNLEIINLLRGDFQFSLFLSPSVAQKHIDNVLDIKDDELPEGSVTDVGVGMVKSKTMSSITEVAKKEDSVWGSFNGSFFENKAASSPITNPPPRKSDTSSGKHEETANAYLIKCFCCLVESLEIISRTSSTLSLIHI